MAYSKQYVIKCYKKYCIPIRYHFIRVSLYPYFSYSPASYMYKISINNFYEYWKMSLIDDINHLLIINYNITDKFIDKYFASYFKNITDIDDAIQHYCLFTHEIPYVLFFNKFEENKIILLKKWHKLVEFFKIKKQSNKIMTTKNLNYLDNINITSFD